MLIVAVFFFLAYPKSLFFIQPWIIRIQGFCESHGVSELKLLFNMMLRLHVPIFR
jgi:hypothetical protein